MLRKHRAPKGALRLSWSAQLGSTSQSQKGPSAKRCIKTCEREAPGSHGHTVRKHRAPKGAFRRSCDDVRDLTRAIVRKRRAPKGALRRFLGVNPMMRPRQVRKHRAPKGALRQPQPANLDGPNASSQKAPSAKRCIKTSRPNASAACRARSSESTERQKVH